MRAQIKRREGFKYAVDGIHPVEFPFGTIVESPIAENALSVGAAVVIETYATKVTEPEERKAEAPKAPPKKRGRPKKAVK